MSSTLCFFAVVHLTFLVFAYTKYYNMIVGKKVFLCGKNIFQNINGRIYFGFYLSFWPASWWVMILFFRLLIKKYLIMGAYWELHLHYITYYLLISLLFRIENKYEVYAWLATFMIDFWGKILSLLFIILNLSILYKIYSLRREKSKYLIYTAYIIFGVNVIYGIQWLLKELISKIST